jgi:hypothetical protein
MDAVGMALEVHVLLMGGAGRARHSQMARSWGDSDSAPWAGQLSRPE